MERKIPLRENWLIFWGIWGEAALIIRILGANEKYFQGADEFFGGGGFGGDQCIFLGIKGAQTPLGASVV